MIGDLSSAIDAHERNVVPPARQMSIARRDAQRVHGWMFQKPDLVWRLGCARLRVSLHGAPRRLIVHTPEALDDRREGLKWNGVPQWRKILL
jgi:hypothetical protein